jgi:hypothetical protein
MHLRVRRCVVPLVLVRLVQWGCAPRIDTGGAPLAAPGASVEADPTFRLRASKAEVDLCCRRLFRGHLHLATVVMPFAVRRHELAPGTLAYQASTVMSTDFTFNVALRGFFVTVMFGGMPVVAASMGRGCSGGEVHRRARNGVAGMEWRGN